MIIYIIFYQILLPNNRIIYNHNKLFEKMNQDGVISKKDIDTHLTMYTKITEDEEHFRETYARLLHIFTLDRFIIEYINDSDTYPIKYSQIMIDRNERVRNYYKIYRYL
jgi:hypothetical protein